MSIQFLLMIITFLAALAYVGYKIYRSISPKSNGCASGCGKCAANFDQVPTPKN